MVDWAAVMTNYTGAFPDVVANNVSAPGAGDGTEYVKVLVDHIWGKDQALMNYAGLTPDGVSEADGTAQILTALARGYAIGPGIGVIYWKNGTPSANGDRVLLLQGQVILIASYSALVAATYVGDGNNAAVAAAGGAFYKTSDAGGTTPDTAGAYFVLPDTRGLSLKNIGDATVNGRTKTGPVLLGEMQEDQFQAWQLGSTKTKTYYAVVEADDAANTGSASVNYGNMRANTAYQGNSAMLTAFDDGTNGTPRTGLNTRDSAIGTNFGITY